MGCRSTIIRRSRISGTPLPPSASLMPPPTQPYRPSLQGYANPGTGAAGPLDGSATNVVSGVAPYWRAAYEYNWDRHSLEVGVYGATFKLFPGGSTADKPAPLQGATNRFQEVAEDAQYQFLGESHIFTA